MTGLVSVTALPRLVTTRDRLELTLPEGVTLAGIVGRALPDLAPGHRIWVRVLMGDRIVPEEAWATTRPTAGDPVVVQVLPAGGSGSLRMILSIVVTVAALALGQIWAVPLAGALGVSAATAGGIITGATLFAGQLLVNALVPPPKAATNSNARHYSIDSARNSIAPDAPVPLALGTLRWAPPYAALPYTEEVGDDLWWTAAFCLGYGPLAISELKIGDTPIEKYSDVQIEIRNGYADDAPLSLYSQQVHEESLSVELSRDAGPVSRVSGGDAGEISVQLTFPAGLFWTKKKTGERRATAVLVRIRQRLAGTDTWSDVATLTIEDNKTSTFRHGHRWAPPARGRYEIEVARLTDDHDEDDAFQDLVTWTALRTFRPEYPIHMPPGRPLALVAIRMRASKQLQGALEELSMVTSSIHADWDPATSAWVEQATRSPAAHYRRLLQGAHLAWPLPDEDLDLAGIADWWMDCAAAGITYDSVITDEGTLGDALKEVCHIGRARPYDRGDVLGVVVDKPRALITTAITERNARNIRRERPYTRYPDAVRVKFRDADNDYKWATRIVPWIGFTGVPTITEEWECPGIADAGLAWTWARRRMRELIYRPDVYTAEQTIEHLVVEPGSRVALASRRLRSDMQVAQLVRASGRILWLDSAVTMIAGTPYRVRIRSGDGSSRTADVAPVAADQSTDTLHLSDVLSPAPDRGDIVMLGPWGEEIVDAVVVDIEGGEGMSAILTLAAHAPEIDEETAADIPPVWDGRAGGEAVADDRVPLAPRITAIESGYLRAGDPSEALVRMMPGTGDPVAVARYDLRHRAGGAGAWTDLAGQTSIALVGGYGVGTHPEFAARAISAWGVPGPWCDPVAHTMLPATAPGPEVENLTIIRLADGSTRIAWVVANGTGYQDQIAARLRYRAGTAPVGEAWGWDDLEPLHAGLLLASPFTTAVPVDGPGTYAVRAEDAAGDAGPVLIGIHDNTPLAPAAISATVAGVDVHIAVRLRADLTAAAVRIYRSPLAADPSIEIDMSGALAAGPSARVNWTDTDPGPGPWRYRARAETADGVASAPSPSAEAAP